MSILLTLLILGVIILIHELGHFLAARMFKIPVSEFAIGMGPKLITFHGKATDYNLRLVPMGGFVNIEGMEFDKVTENGFNSKKAWQRFVVLFAGVFMNFILAFLISFGSTMAVGGEYKLNDNTDGFIYMVSSASITGAQSNFNDDKVAYFERINAMNLKTPRMIGFGISNKQTLESAQNNASGAIIGSKFVTLLNDTGSPDVAMDKLYDALKK